MTYYSYSANVLQTIGRGRAARRQADTPLRVLLFCAEPVEGLPVDRLVRLSELAGMSAISERQRAALDAGREARNDVLHNHAVNRVAAALQVVGATQTATIQQIAQQAGVDRHTVAHIIKEAANHDGDTGLLIDLYRSPAPPRVLAPPLRGEQSALFVLPPPVPRQQISKNALRKAKRRANRPD